MTIKKIKNIFKNVYQYRFFPYFYNSQSKTNHMYTYKLDFENGKKMKTISENLTLAESKIVAYMEKENLINCTITCPNGIVRRVRKTGEWHWNHNGYSFD